MTSFSAFVDSVQGNGESDMHLDHSNLNTKMSAADGLVVLWYFVQFKYSAVVKCCEYCM